MKLENVKKKFKNQWILAKVKKRDPQSQKPTDVEVIEHSTSRKKTYEAMKETRAQKLIHFYNGLVPKRGKAIAV